MWVHGDTVMDLVVDGEVIATTEDHPFWSVTDQRFERADQLDPGESVLSATGQPLTVTGLTRGSERQTLAYNLTVDGIHTYHVGKGEALVHNDCPLPNVHWGQQAKHFVGHPNYKEGASQLFANPEVLINRAGSGAPLNQVPRGQAGFRERIDFGEVIGNYVSRESGPVPTSNGVLHYRADGSVHIVPARPN